MADGLTRTQAEAELRRLLTQADLGEFDATTAHETTFRQACDEYLRYTAEDRKRRPSTVTDYRSSIEAVLVPHFGANTSLTAIGPREVDIFSEG